MQKRFSGKAGQEYKLLLRTIPYYGQFEGMIDKAIKKHFKKSLQKKLTVVEIGTGTGITTKKILDADKRTLVISIDNEPVMANQARINLAKYHKRVKFIINDALKFLKTMPENSFDCISSAATIHNFDRKYRLNLLKNCYRVLKRGGLFVNADKYAYDNKREFQKTLDWQTEMYYKEFSKIKRPDLIKEWVKHEDFDKKSNILMCQNKSIGQMKKIGFKNVKIIYRKHMHAVLVAEK